jgi:hypothetical protein
MPAQEMEAYAARCIEIASQSTDPFVQRRLIEMAQRWMGWAMDEEDGEGAERNSEIVQLRNNIV